jgi:hypothetical protein
LVAAVKRYNEGTVHAPPATEGVEMLAEVPSDLDEEDLTGMIRLVRKFYLKAFMCLIVRFTGQFNT